MPPRVIFADLSEWCPAHIAARSIGGDADTEAVLDDVVEASRALDLQWRDLLLAARGY